MHVRFVIERARIPIEILSFFSNEKGEIKIPRDRREFEFEKLINIGNSAILSILLLEFR